MIPLIKDDYDTSLLFHAKSKDRCIPLIASKVVFDFIFKDTNRRLGGGECEIVDAGTGLVKYIFKSPELSQPGTYIGKVTIDLTQGARREAIPLEFQIIDQNQASPAPAQG